ncbi:MAG: FliM/FliN family flagellar motor switch protein [Phycisphaerae bacterium]|nr:FliM/FliN family flagellar motor switch protein [Phycisphaerae bacterium]
MPDTAANAPVESPPREDLDETTPQDDGKTQVRSVEFPSAPQSAVAAGTGQLDILLDMDIPITVVLGTTQIPVRRLLQLGPGSVLQLEKSVETPVDLFMKDSKFAEADVVVVENRFAVRIRQIVAAAAPAAVRG